MSFLLAKCCCGARTSVPIWKWAPCETDDGYIPPLYGSEQSFRRMAYVSINDYYVSYSFDYTDPCNPTYEVQTTYPSIGPAYPSGVVYVNPKNNGCNISTEGVCGTLSFAGYWCPNSTCGSCFCPCPNWRGTGCSPDSLLDMAVIGCGAGPAGWDPDCFVVIEKLDDFDPETMLGIWMDKGYVDGVEWNGPPYSSSPPPLTGGFEDVAVTPFAYEDCCASGCFTDTCEYIGQNITVTAAATTNCSGPSAGTSTVTVDSYYYDAATQDVVIEGTVTVDWAAGTFDDYCQCDREGISPTPPCCSVCVSPEVTVSSGWEIRVDACAIAAVLGGAGTTPSRVLDNGGVSKDGTVEEYCFYDLFGGNCPPTQSRNLEVNSRVFAYEPTAVGAVGYGGSVTTTAKFGCRYLTPEPINTNCSLYPGYIIGFYDCSVDLTLTLPADPCP
jgi:hypothetical protein